MCKLHICRISVGRQPDVRRAFLSDVRRTSDGRLTYVRRTCVGRLDGRPTDVQWTYVGRLSDIRRTSPAAGAPAALPPLQAPPALPVLPAPLAQPDVRRTSVGRGDRTENYRMTPAAMTMTMKRKLAGEGMKISLLCTLFFQAASFS